MKTLSALLLFIAVNAMVTTFATAKELDPNTHKSIHCCYLLKKRYTFAVSERLYEQMIKWNLESKDTPPVSPQKVYKLAKERLDKIVIPKGYFWTFEQAALRPVNKFYQDGKWIWVVSFRYTKEGFSSGVWPTMDFFVTMDGDLIEPIIDDWEH